MPASMASRTETGRPADFAAQVFGDVDAHQLVRSVMRTLASSALGVVVINEAAAVAGGDFQIAAHEIAFGHAMRAHDAEAAMLVGGVQVGVEGEGGAGFVLEDRGLEVDDVAVRAEGVVDGFPDGFLDVEDLGLGIGGRARFPAGRTFGPRSWRPSSGESR